MCVYVENIVEMIYNPYLGMLIV